MSISCIMFNEPTYPLTKTEYFDEDVMKGILTDEAFSKADRKRLSAYAKHKVGAGKVLVSYRLGLGCEELNVGRLYPEDGLGLQSFSKIMRNPLTVDKYWDLDIENCHYKLAEHYCDKYGLKHDSISEYCDDRDEWLYKTSKSRTKAKTEYLKILYGGNIKLYNDDFVEQEGEIEELGCEFLKNIEKEVKNLMETIWNKNPALHKFKGAGKIPINKKPNPKASLMSLVFQTTERKILMWIDSILKKAGRPFEILIHDGGNIRKLEKETLEQFEDWLETINDALCDYQDEDGKNVSYTATVKEIKSDWKPRESQQSPYERMKQEFEKTHKIIGGNLLCIHEDGYRETIKLNKKDPRFTKYNWTEYGCDPNAPPKKMYFMNEWLDDDKVIHYERQDFIPDMKKCPATVFNLFDGFEAEKIDYPEMTDEKIKELVKPIKTHLNYLTTENGKWLLKWLSSIIKDPMNKSMVTPMIRDEGNWLIMGGGTGKTTFMDWIMSKVIGEKYCYTLSNNADLYGSFNGFMEGKLLIAVEEVNGDSNFKNSDVLKAKLTQKKITVNKKSIEAYSVNDYSRHILFTNNRNPVPINSHSRRFAVMDTNPVKRGDETYFKELFTHLDKPEVIVAFYRYLKRLGDVPASPIDWFKSIPNTSALREVMYLNSTPFVKWLIYSLKNATLHDALVSQIYADFVRHCKEKREGKEEAIMTETMFGLTLNKCKEGGEVDIGTKCRNADGMEWKWNIPNIIKHLKNQSLIPDEFHYEGFIRK